IRRAILHKRSLRANDKKLFPLIPLFLETIYPVFPEINLSTKDIVSFLEEEETLFDKTLEQGILQIEKKIHFFNPGMVLSGEEAFLLYDTYGLPIDVTEEFCETRKISVDRIG